MSGRTKSRRKGREAGKSVKRDRKYASLVASGRAICTRCGKLIKRDGRWELSLDPLGPAHTTCCTPQTSREW